MPVFGIEVTLFLFCLSSVIPVNSRIPGTLDSPGKSGMTGMTGIPVIPGAGPALEYDNFIISARQIPSRCLVNPTLAASAFVV